MKKKYNLEISDYKEFADAGAWRSYDLQASGDTLEELFDDSHVFEVDQDGGDITDYKECGFKEMQAIVDELSDEGVSCYWEVTVKGFAPVIHTELPKAQYKVAYKNPDVTVIGYLKELGIEI